MNIAQAHRAVAEAARPYESRWTLRALLSIDKELYHRFREQQQLWHAAQVTGSDDDLEEQTEAMCRGWAAITVRMEGQPDDAYLIGVCPRTGTRVAIGDQLAARDRVRQIDGELTIWLTPAEVATLMGSAQTLASLKGLFPNAELVELYPSEPRAA